MTVFLLKIKEKHFVSYLRIPTSLVDTKNTEPKVRCFPRTEEPCCLSKECPMKFSMKLPIPVRSALIFLLLTSLAGLSARKLYTDGYGIIDIADDYLGVPYKYGGTTPSGFDCSGFTGYVYKRAGYRLPRGADDQYRALNPIKKPEIGDLVFFKIDGKRVSHVGIYVGGFRFIHSPRTGKSVGYADLRTKYWKKRYAGARTIFHRIAQK